MAISSNATGLRPGVCTSTTRPTTPYTGQIIFQTDTGTMHNWDGAAWQFLAPTQQRNLLYNGAMQVAQRGTSTASITTSGYYTADRWLFAVSSAGTWTESVENDAPTGSGFRKSTKLLCTTSDASLAAGDLALFLQILEGQDLQALRKGTSQTQPVTMSFWVKSNMTGTYILDIFDSTNTRGISRSYTVSSAGTWEFKTITFPGDTVGTLNNDNAGSLNFRWWLAAGSSYQSGTLQTSWATSSSSVAVGQVNLASAVNNYWQVTGVQLNVGAVAAPFEFKSFGQELRECQRYYYSSYSNGVAINGADTISGHHQAIGVDTASAVLQNGTFAVPMRSTPTVNFYQPRGGVGSGSMRNHSTGGTDVTGVSVAGVNNRGLGYVAKVGSLSLGTFYGMEITADAEL